MCLELLIVFSYYSFDICNINNAVFISEKKIQSKIKRTI